MARKSYVVFLVLLLARCAQVGTLTGGPKDEVAPKPVEEEMVPANATTNYQGNSFVIPFNEYFQLNNPAQTIRMVPPHATVSAEAGKKTLYLNWEDTLEANTTYAIYLNGTIKDLNEGNDTTLQIVFSTGDIIDSITYSTAVTDAFSRDPLSDITVALFDPESNRLKSFAKSNNGIAELNYLSPGDYRMIAFEDENLDLEVGPEERVGFPEGEIVRIDSSFFDSIPVRTFMPFPKQRYKIKSFVPPGAFSLEGTSSLEFYGLDAVTVNGKPADFFLNKARDTYFVVSPDTLAAPSAEIVISHRTDSTNITDTLTYRFRNRDLSKPVKLKPLHNMNIAPGDSLRYELYGDVESWNDSLIKLMLTEDSSFISDYTIKSEGHQLTIVFSEPLTGSVLVNFDKGAIQTIFGATQSFVETVTLDTESDYGILNIDLSGYESPIILELIKGGKVTKSIPIRARSEPLTLGMLDPGSYTFRIIHDDNGNQLWDIGDFEELRQPERVDMYSKEVKVRANWEVDISLNPQENE